jgi:hypothetical protein
LRRAIGSEPLSEVLLIPIALRARARLIVRVGVAGKKRVAEAGGGGWRKQPKTGSMPPPEWLPMPLGQ